MFSLFGERVHDFYISWLMATILYLQRLEFLSVTGHRLRILALQLSFHGIRQVVAIIDGQTSSNHSTHSEGNDSIPYESKRFCARFCIGSNNAFFSCRCDTRHLAQVASRQSCKQWFER